MNPSRISQLVPTRSVRRPSTLSAFFAALLLLQVLSVAALAQTAQWIRQAGTGGISNGISSDAAGNSYATGLVSNAAVFENLTIPSYVSDVFVAKYDAAGALLWAKVNGGELLDQGYDIATDAAGNSYVAGAIQTNSLYPTSAFDNITLTGHGDYDWFIAKYDVNGNVVWAKNGGGPQGDIAQGVALDAAGNVYVCGFFSGTMTLDNVTLTSSGIFDVFIAKFDPAGTLLWMKRAGGTGSDQAHRIVADAAGNIVIVGEFQTTAFFDGHSVNSAGLGNAFIAKYDAAGNNLWVRSGGSTTSFATDPARSIAADGASNYYITGDFTGTASFDGLNVTSTGLRDIFVAKYDTNGAIQWLHHAGGPRAEEGHSIGVDQVGNAWVSGFLASGPGVAFDHISLAPRGNEYVFLAKYDPTGAALYVKQYAAGRGQAVHVLNDGSLHFSGGASKSSAGNEFDNVSLAYVDRGAFMGKFSEPGDRFPLVSTSRKVQGTTMADLNLPVTGAEAVECRTGGATGDHRVLVNFGTPITLKSASLTTGIGQVAGVTMTGSQVAIDLTGVANAQRLVITLADVSDGTRTADVAIPMGILLGDINGNGIVTASDVAQVKAQSGQAIDAFNYRSDVTASGTINASDTALVKAMTGTVLP